MPDGTVKHYDNYYTHYRPWDNFYTYGAGVTPPAGVNVLDPRVVYAPPPPRLPRSYDDDGLRHR
jgi:hypothetical protein